ncbi:MAG: hemolysin family protein [Planctomycetota bacterium]
MSAAAAYWMFAAGAAATVFASLGVRALRDFSRHELEEVCSRRGLSDRFGEILRLHEGVALGAEVLLTLSIAVLVVATGFVFTNAEAAPLPFVFAEFVTLVVCFTCLPWAASRVFAEPFLAATWPLWKVLAAAATPAVWVAKLLDTGLHRLLGRTPESMDEETFEEEIRTIVTEGHREGLLEEDAREMIEGVIELGDADVSKIMTPRTDMKMVQVDEPWEEVVADVIESAHTRIPAYSEDRDDIVGVLYSKDLLPELATGDAGSRTPIRELVRKALFVPETKRLDDLLQMFQQTRTHIAMVMDEYGGVSGLVTIEDVLEEIVGEIVDEYDAEEEQEIVLINETTCEALGRAHVDDVNEALRISLPDDGDFDTIGGFVFTELGRVPRTGESFRWNETAYIEVLEVTKRRILRVRVQRIDSGRLESA